MMADAALHLIATIMAASGAVVMFLPQARRGRDHPLAVLLFLFVLLTIVHGLAVLKALGHSDLGRLIDFGRLGTPVLWFFLVYSWLQLDSSRRFVDSESRFRQFMEHNPAIAFLKDVDGRYIFGNKAWAEQFDVPLSELLGKTDAELWSRETAAVFEQSDRAAREGQIVVLEEQGRREQNGKSRWFEVRKFPVPRSDGQVMVGGVVIEVTARKEVMAELASSEARYRLLFERNPSPMWVVDSETLRFLDVNPAAISHYGYSREEFLAMTLRDIRPVEDVPALERLIRSLPDEVAHAGVWRHRKKDGTIIHVSIASDTINVAGRGAKLAVMHDVTEQRAALEALKETQYYLERAQSVAHVGSWWSDPAEEGKLVWSKETYQIFGFREEEFDGRVETFFRLVHPDDLERVRAASRDSIENGTPFSIDHRIIRPDGKIAWVHEQATVLRDEQGGATRMIGISQDITERMEAQQRHEQLEAELAQVKRLEAVGTLAAGVAHDFSNLLTAMQGHLALADRALAPDHAARKSLRMAEKVAQQGISMTRNMLTFAHQMPSAKVPCNFAETVADVMHLLRHLIPASIDVQTSLGNEPLWVLADRAQLQQVLMNLLINARDAMPAGGKLTVSVEHVPADEPRNHGGGEAARLAVEDTGIGMDEATLQRIFEPFFTTKARGKGSGLGLAMVHGIVTDHGGHISARSTPGAGTRFEIDLPLCPPPPDEGQPADTRDAGFVVAPRNRTVVLAVPPTFVREIMVTTLESAGYPVVLREPAGPLDPVERLGEEAGVVVIDADALTESSESALDFLRRLSAIAPVVAVTANTAVFLDEPASPRFQFLAKPFQMSQLTQRVDHALGINQAGEP